MENLFETYKKWRELTEPASSKHRLSPDSGSQEHLELGDDIDYGDKKAFMKYAKLKKLDYDDFEELELQYDEYLIEMETQ